MDKSRYDALIEEVRLDGNLQEKTVKPIDILRRLNENTKSIGDVPPATSDQAFNNLLRGLVRDNNQAKLQQALDYMNNRLITMMKKGEIGIEPNLILAFAFLDRKGFQALQKLTYEDQMGAYKKEWFVSILKFQELTASANDYNESDFQNFIEKVRESSSMEEAYGLISIRVLKNISGLSKGYREKGKKDTGFLWSGNTAHELIGLIDYKSAETMQGKRAVEESMRRKLEPGYHHGD